MNGETVTGVAMRVKAGVLWDGLLIIRYNLKHQPPTFLEVFFLLLFSLLLSSLEIKLGFMLFYILVFNYGIICQI